MIKKVPTKSNCSSSSSTISQTITGMRFFIPPHSDKIKDKDADMILKGMFHQIVSMGDTENKKQALLEYLIAVGSAVPLPKTMVVNPLKEKLKTPLFVTSIGSLAAPREVSTTALIAFEMF